MGDDDNEELRNLRAENDKLRYALEFYDRRENWGLFDVGITAGRQYCTYCGEVPMDIWADDEAGPWLEARKVLRPA